MTHKSSQVNAEDDRAQWMLCTLFEGDYHFGLAALVNSLVEHGFRGLIVAGYRGSLPPWTYQLKPVGNDGEYYVGSEIRMRFVHLDTPVHFTNFKPYFMRQLIREQPDCKYIWYFDPDIVIHCSWSFYFRWAKYGVALCEDVNGKMPANHPLRFRWMEVASSLGLGDSVPLSGYYNGGFIGLSVNYSGFLDLWQEVIKFAESEGLDTRQFRMGGRVDPFYAADQDALNVAAMYSRYPLTTIGPEGMDFITGGFTMAHAIGSPKPWNKNMVVAALCGAPPSNSDKAFLAHLDSPIRPYSHFRLAAKRLGCSIGAFIGRFYRRH
jgi:hypothetical protein